MNIDNFIVSEKKSLREALEKINNNNSGTVFIVNKDKIVVGVATDGDIRRKLLSCLLYTSPSPRDRQKSRMPSSA